MHAILATVADNLDTRCLKAGDKSFRVLFPAYEFRSDGAIGLDMPIHILFKFPVLLEVSC